MTAVTFKANAFRNRSHPLYPAAGSGSPARRVFRGPANLRGLAAASRPRIITTSLAPLPSELPVGQTWQRVGNLVRLGMALIALAGVVKTTGAFSKGAFFVMLLLEYLTR